MPSKSRHVTESVVPAATAEDGQRNSPPPSDPAEAVGERHLREPDVDVSDPDAAERASREDIARPVQGGDVTPAAVVRTGWPSMQQLAGEKAIAKARKEQAAEAKKAEANTARAGGRSQDDRVVPAHPTGGRVSGDRR